MNNLDRETVKTQILDGMTIMELAKHYGCSRTTITNFKKENGLVGLSKNGRTKAVGGVKLCKSCGTTKDLSEFYSNGYYNSGTKKYKPNCKSCEKQIKNKQHYSRIVEILAGSDRELKCELCGYKSNLSALQFHHVDPSEKDYAISEMKSLAFEKVRDEINKCAVLCANCHTEIHNPHLDFDRFFGGE